MSSRGKAECVINPAVSVTCALFMYDSQNSKPRPHKEQKLLSEAGAGVLIEHATVPAYRSSASRILWWKSSACVAALAALKSTAVLEKP